ncbi:DUF7341 domain-containing protein [Nocardia thailandica]|uniref:DUF7341 domain-containing protein n=1 Tax=Nocardia thailandica TaxID=257275 RepID=UPI0002E9B3CD|nr:hypothetical protein [Nocardia thailandica]
MSEDDLVVGHRRALADAVHALVGMQVERVERDGRQVSVPIDSLYDQLAESTHGQQQDGSGARRPEPGSRAPGWADALSLLEVIDRRVGEWSIGQASVPGRAVTPRRLYALADHPWAPEDLAAVRRMTRQVHEWARRVRALLDEEREWELRAACPSCGALDVTTRNGAGEEVRTYALRANLSSAQCIACGTSWAPEQYRLLGALIGAPLPNGILE